MRIGYKLRRLIRLRFFYSSKNELDKNKVRESENRDWKLKAENWAFGISDKTAILMLNLCESKLKESVDTAKNSASKAERIITMFIPVMTALIIYIFNHLDKQDWLWYSAIFALVPTFLGIMCCVINMESYEIHVPGTEPKDIFVEKFIDSNAMPEHKHLDLIYLTAEGYQKALDENSKIIEIRVLCNDFAIKCFIALALCPIAGYFIQSLF